jgi:hypothetical protein
LHPNGKAFGPIRRIFEEGENPDRIGSALVKTSAAVGGRIFTSSHQ